MNNENKNTKHSIYRWIHETLPDGTIINSIRVVLADDHDRVVSQLMSDVAVLRSKNSIIGPATTDCIIEELHETIAMQKRVIDQLTVQRNALVVFPGIENSIEKLDREIERSK